VDTAGYGANIVENSKTWVDAQISITQTDTNGIGEPHTFIVLVERDLGDGGGFIPAIPGVIVTPTISGTGSITGETCTAGTLADGTCTITVSSDVAGTATVHASGTVDAGGVDIFVATDGYGAFVVSNQKTWIDGSLTWLKHDSQGNLLGGATFEVCRTHDRFGDPVADPCMTVFDNLPPDADGDSGEFKLENLYLGRYTIAEVLPPAGYQGDPWVETVELTLANPDGASTYIWVNVPGQGCTPGWWKNQGLGAYDDPADTLAMAVEAAVESHWGAGWIYLGTPEGDAFEGTTTSLFRVAFNLTPAEMTAQGLDPDLTLLGAVELGGGDFNALARHGTSALLNSLSVAYEYSSTQVLDDVHDAFIAGDVGTLIDDYDTANKRDHSACPAG
jgi:hypothetical protein